MTRDDDLEERVDELQRSLEELRREIEPRPPRGPGGLPRPPTPGELVRFADRQAIPTAIAVLEANVRALELLQEALRLADTGRAAGEGAERTRERAEDLSRRSLDRLDAVLDDLQEATRGDTLPPDGDERDILEDARRLREEIADRIEEAEREGQRYRTRGRTSGAEGSTTSEGVTIDVEDELDSIRAELDGDDATENGDENGTGADESTDE
ncbi:hypothetical protein [Halalkalicoccus sp. NIPERK01]|uniref:DUF7547 family protein n=1 Tax=Halalkalicoccus sp. NIPERK01 TaxID=3053469 RepID=UPI00256F5BF1|nr:hypothetical protein [Halalkalicoccus sp. NIPERK01]MDL5360788.1 hypothetical protein [Halalkalicoccus sp. NIPERK01]